MMILKLLLAIITLWALTIAIVGLSRPHVRRELMRDKKYSAGWVGQTERMKVLIKRYRPDLCKKIKNMPATPACHAVCDEIGINADNYYPSLKLMNRIEKRIKK